MKEKRPWRLWCTFLAILIGCLNVPVVLCQSYNEGPAKGDTEDNPVAALGFSGVVSRHDGYVKGETPTIPQTSFSCSNQPHNPGLYADMETQCQVYHVCFEDRQESFLCGPGTNFNQRILACDFWYNFNCQESATFYGVNADIGKVPDTVYRPNVDQPRQPQPQRPSYPSYPEPDRPTSGSYQPPRVSVPPPPPRPQPPRVQPQPQPPRPHTDPPRFNPEPQPPRIPPRVQPQPPRIQPPSFQPQPQPPSFQPQQPQQPSFQPQQPSYQPPPQPQPPRIHPQPQPPRIHPQPPRVSSPPPQSQYPRVPQGSGQPAEVRPPPTRPVHPSYQQEEDSGYHFDGDYNPQTPIHIQPQQPVYPLTPRPVFPPVVSPPRVSRPPLTPPVIRQPSGSVSRPRVPVSRPNIPQYPDHPDANIKGQTDYRPSQQPRIPQPSRPVGTGYPSYPVSRPPTQKPVKPYQPPPPPPIQQEHIDTDYIPPPPPPPPKQPSKPIFVRPPPPPPPPVHQEVTDTEYIKRPPPSRPSYVPPQEPIDADYGRPQPPVSPSVIREQQKPAVRPPSRPQTSVSSRPSQPRQPQRPRPVFPPSIDHPNANIKGGPGYQQPPPPPRFEPTRISRPSTSQSGYLTPPETPKPKPVTSGGYQPVIAVKPVQVKQPSHSGSTGYKPPQQRIKKPSEPTGSIYQPPITPVIDHPRSEIKGSDYERPVIHQQPQRIQSPSTSSGVKRPQRPRAPVVVSRPKKPIEPIYEKPEPQAPATSVGRVKLPSQTQTTVTSQRQQPRFPTGQHIDHPDANLKGGSTYNRRPQPQTIPARISRPSSNPSSPSISYEQKTTSPHQSQGSGSGYPVQQPYPPKGDDDYYQQEIDYHQSFKPQRRPQANIIQPVQKVPQGGQDEKDVYPRPPSSSQHIVVIKPSQAEYDAGSSYTRGPDIYPKPEFGQANAPYKPPVSTPSRSSQIAKERPASSQNSILPQTKPVYQGSPATSGSGTQLRPENPFREVPGYQPPYQRQVFPHRENPDHPNESLKGSAAYRPPPPAGFQSAASEVQQHVVPEPEPEASSPLLGDIGAE